jgi:hypothetical protein
MWKMEYKLIKNFHVEDVVLGKIFNLGMIGSFFHTSTLGTMVCEKKSCLFLQILSNWFFTIS